MPSGKLIEVQKVRLCQVNYKMQMLSTQLTKAEALYLVNVIDMRAFIDVVLLNRIILKPAKANFICL
jgi:hypothetical protein